MNKTPADAYNKGKAAAEKDLAEGKIILKSAGAPPDPSLEKFYKKTYNIRFIQPGGCTQHIFNINGYDTTEAFFSELEGYNDRVKAHLESIHGKDFFEKADRAYKAYIRTKENPLLKCKELIWRRRNNSAK